MYPAVVKVTPSEDFTLAVLFGNGEEGVLRRMAEPALLYILASVLLLR